MSLNNLIWFEKHRPKTFKDMSLPVVHRKAFEHYVEQNSFPHLLLEGSPGSGKSSTAFILMSLIPCVKIMFNGSTVGIDVVRTTITDFAKSKAPQGKIKVVLLDEADKIKVDALGSLHNVMETYSTNCRFILTCNHVDKIDKPIQSRCTKYTFAQFPKNKLTRLVTSILEQEGVENTSEEDISDLINKFYPDVRSIINNLQAACISGSFNAKAIGSLQIDPKQVGEFILAGKVQSLRQYIAGTTEFSFMYKWLFNTFLYEKVNDDLKADVALTILQFTAIDQQVPDREMQFVGCALSIMLAMSIKPSFGA